MLPWSISVAAYTVMRHHLSANRTGHIKFDRMVDSGKNLGTGIRLAEVSGASGNCLRLLPHLRVILRSYENKRGVILDRAEPFAQLKAGHPLELDVEYQAGKLRSGCVGKEIFGRKVTDRLKVCGPQ